MIIGRLQGTWEPGKQPEGVWVLDGSDFPKQGIKRWEWPGNCGRLGKVANCKAGVPGLCQPVGTGGRG